MASDTKNVKLGVCKLFFNGKDLGYTQGGVEVTVKTDTHKVNVDQFGKSTINEYILGRNVMVKTPLAETTLDNLIAIMPGASLVTDGVAATGTVTIFTQLTAGQTVVINGKTLTARASQATVTGPADFVIGATVAGTAANLAAVIDFSSDPLLVSATAAAVGANVNVVYLLRGVVGNAFTLASGTAGASVTVSAATLSGGIDPTTARVDVTNGIGIDLLSISKELRLHPKSKPDNDHSEDFVIPMANTPGALKFMYKIDSERIYDCEFMGFPDPVTGRLFYIGQ